MSTGGRRGAEKLTSSVFPYRHGEFEFEFDVEVLKSISWLHDLEPRAHLGLPELTMTH